jgi:hypothetical protein
VGSPDEHFTSVIARFISWAGNAAIVASWVFYVDALFGFSHPSGLANWGIALVGLWVPAAINLAGVRQVAWFINAFETIFPHGTWAGKLITAAAVVSGIGGGVPGTGRRRPVPAAVRLDRPQRLRLVQHRDRGRAALAAHALAVHRQHGTDGLHLPG